MKTSVDTSHEMADNSSVVKSPAGVAHVCSIAMWCLVEFIYEMPKF